MKYKSTVFNTIIIITTIVVGIIIANKIYYDEKKLQDNNKITYIHIENNITPFVFNKLVVSTPEEKKKEEPIIPVEKPKEDKEAIKKETPKTPEIVSNLVFDGLTMEQLVIKLNNNMKNELSNMGQLYAEYSLSLGVDPYVALAITLQETGCSRGRCDIKVKECNNVGGQKGTPRCGSGSYKKYDSLEEGIKGYLDNLSNNYYKKGLNTPELMNPKYASDENWANQINKFVNTIKSS